MATLRQAMCSRKDLRAVKWTKTINNTTSYEGYNKNLPQAAEDNRVCVAAHRVTGQKRSSLCAMESHLHPEVLFRHPDIHRHERN
jgi:hypothetical protein